ncbi:hypothetical protein EVAR_18902_1 [Eumeta japonica]|uniref:SWIM-type domain-containing protein n=1 Tax=Eumeta variegata TaxID=151549 RepID=A0A4C1V2J3_EUMVA|nr:hypothetical protein EVAR_18902_1 [Eumeta japonica]
MGVIPVIIFICGFAKFSNITLPRKLAIYEAGSKLALQIRRSRSTVPCARRPLSPRRRRRGLVPIPRRRVFGTKQEVVEIRDSGGGFIHGKVTPQTRVNNRPYDVKVEVNLDRTVRRTECTCKAGLSVRGCKHVAAVCIFINNECTQSKTDQPQCWNQPRESQVEKYKKGCTIAQMFPGQEHLIDCNATYTFNDVQNVPYCTEGSLFGQYIQSEKDIEPLREIAREEEEKGKKKLDDLKCDFENTCPPELQSKYEEKIVADRSECLSISVLSESQSDCFEWFEERANELHALARLIA